MKNLCAFLVIVLMLFAACSQKPQKNVVVITGNVVDATGSATFEWIKEHSADIKPKAYFAPIDSLGNFKIEIPLQQLSLGTMTINGTRYNVAFEPHDQIDIKIDKDTVLYSGTGAEKNLFLYKLSKNDKCSRMAIFMSWYQQEHELKDYFIMIEGYINARKAAFDDFIKSYTLSKAFVNYFEIENELEAISMYQQGLDIYAQKNNMSVDSIKIPKEFERNYNLKNLANDKFLVNSNFLFVLDEMLYSHVQKAISGNASLKRDSLKLSFMMDSLSGSIREHYFVQSIFYDLTIYDRYDSAMVASFNKIKQDNNCIAVVDREIEKYNAKQNMIGVKLNNEVGQTTLRDTANNLMSMNDVLAKHEGKVIYLDIWSLGCGPCRKAMPFSKKLKENLKNYPVAFVYVTVDEYSENLWSDVFNVSLGKDNHYRFEEGFNAKFLDVFGILGVPTYVLIDKQGKLVNYNAQRPYDRMWQVNTDLEKQLIELSSKI